jgi:hypothetical protein
VIADGLLIARAVAVIALFAVGGGICLLNLYLVVVREPLLKWLGRYDRHVSIVPVVGQLATGLGMMIGYPLPWVFWAGWALLLLDFGGLHVCALTLAVMFVQHRPRG